MSLEAVAKDESPTFRDKSNIICRTCNVKGHISKYCYQNAPGGTLYIRDLPASSNEETVQELMKPFGSLLHVKVGAAIDGSKWDFVNLEKRESGEAAIKELHDMSMKGREIMVKWAEEGMWSCRDPACNKKNQDYMDICIQCKLPKKPKYAASVKALVQQRTWCSEKHVSEPKLWYMLLSYGIC